jgi:hypothetical protein
MGFAPASPSADEVEDETFWVGRSSGKKSLTVARKHVMNNH